MAKGKKTGGRDFQIGNKPKGFRPKLPKEIKELRELNRVMVENLMRQYISMSPKKVLAMAKPDKIASNDDITSLEAMILRVISKGVTSGLTGNLNYLMDVIIGPIVKQINVCGPNGESIIPTKHTVIELVDGKPSKQHEFEGS